MSKIKSWLLDAIASESPKPGVLVVLKILLGLSLVYRCVIRCRNWAYDRKWLSQLFVDANVVSVGNLTTGGTGKTPFVIWLAKRINKFQKVAIVSRGYGKRPSASLNDEGLEIELSVKNIVQVQDKDRFEASRQAMKQLGDAPGSKVVILDDGFQHRRLGRDIDIVLVDSTNPFGYGHLLPRGMLREEISAISRAHAVILTRSNLVPDSVRSKIKSRLRKFNHDLLFAETQLHAEHWLSSDGREVSLKSLDGKKLLAFCGVGNPSAFKRTVVELGFAIEHFVEFNDHYQFQQDDIRDLTATAKHRDCDALVCTMKDLVKISPDQIGDAQLFALKTTIQFLSGEQQVIDLVTDNLTKLKNAG